MVKVERIEFLPNFPNRDEAYSLLRGENGRFAFAWGPDYPYADEVPAQDVKDGASGLEWFDTEAEARAEMQEAVEAWESVRGKLTQPLELIGAAEFARLLGTTQQNVSLAGHRALKPTYSGKFLRPDAVFEGRPLWRRDRAEAFVREYQKK